MDSSYGGGMAGEYLMPLICSTALTTYAFKAPPPPYSTVRNALLGFALGVRMMRAGSQWSRVQPLR